MNELAEHIKKINDQIRVWVNKDPLNHRADYFVEDVDHWKTCGIESVEEFELFVARSTFSDLHKDVYRYRPCDEFIQSLSLDELNEKITIFVEILDDLKCVKIHQTWL